MGPRTLGAIPGESEADPAYKMKLVNSVSLVALQFPSGQRQSCFHSWSLEQ